MPGRLAAVIACFGWTALAVSGAAAAAPPVPLGEADAVALTVYNADLALVRETRPVSLSRGMSVVRLVGVPEAIEARSVQATFRSGGALAEVRGQTFRTDLLAAGRLLENWIGRPLTLVRDLPDGGEERTEATLLSTEGSLLFEAGGQVLLGHPGRVVLPEGAVAATGLTVQPSLDWQVHAPSPGRYEADIRYLTGGLGWTADYVALLAADDGSLSLSAWVTVDNRSSREFADAALRLVAGRVNRVGGPPQPRLRVQMMEAAVADRGFDESALFEYHLYTLDRPVSLPARSLHQVGLFEAPRVPVQRRYLVHGNGPDPRPLSAGGGAGEPRDLPVEVQLMLANDEASGLGRPLPAGVVRVYAAGPGAEQFLGEERLQHTPRDETVVLTIGRAFDLVAERLQTEYQDRSTSRDRRSYEAAFRVNLRNRKDTRVTVQVRESLPGDWTLLNSSHEMARLDASTAAFDVPVPAGGEAVLTYRVRVD